MNRALCLTSVDTDSTESKIDELLNRVTSIALKQKEEVRENHSKGKFRSYFFTSNFRFFDASFF